MVTVVIVLLLTMTMLMVKIMIVIFDWHQPLTRYLLYINSFDSLNHSERCTARPVSVETRAGSLTAHVHRSGQTQSRSHSQALVGLVPGPAMSTGVCKAPSPSSHSETSPGQSVTGPVLQMRGVGPRGLSDPTRIRAPSVSGRHERQV